MGAIIAAKVRMWVVAFQFCPRDEPLLKVTMLKVVGSDSGGEVSMVTRLG